MYRAFVFWLLPCVHRAFNSIPCALNCVCVHTVFGNKFIRMVNFFVFKNCTIVNKIYLVNRSIIWFPKISVDYASWFNALINDCFYCICWTVVYCNREHPTFRSPFHTSNDPCAFDPVPPVVFSSSKFWFVNFDNDILPPLFFE